MRIYVRSGDTGGNDMNWVVIDGPGKMKVYVP
jgi:hypothetical protein